MAVNWEKFSPVESDESETNWNDFSPVDKTEPTVETPQAKPPGMIGREIGAGEKPMAEVGPYESSVFEKARDFLGITESRSAEKKAQADIARIAKDENLSPSDFTDKVAGEGSSLYKPARANPIDVAQDMFESVPYIDIGGTASALKAGNNPIEVAENYQSIKGELKKQEEMKASGEGSGAQYPFGLSSEDFKATAQSLPFSLYSMGAYLAASLPVGAVTKNPIAVNVSGMAASGKAAYNMDAAGILTTLYGAANKTYQDELKKNGKPVADLSPEDFNEFASDSKIQSAVQKHALAEAGFEALGNFITSEAFKGPLKKILLRKSVDPSKKIGEKAADFGLARATSKSLSGELATEIPTQLIQKQAEIEMGLSNGSLPSILSPSDWGNAFTEVFWPTVLTSAIMGGGVKAVSAPVESIKNKKLASKIIDFVDKNGYEVVPTDALKNIYANAKNVQLKRNNDEKLNEVIEVIDMELRVRGFNPEDVSREPTVENGPGFDQTDQFTPTHKADGGIDVMPVTRGGKPVPDTYVDSQGNIVRDSAAVKNPIIEVDPSAFDNGPIDAGAQVDAIRDEVMGGETGDVANQGVIDSIYGNDKRPPDMPPPGAAGVAVLKEEPAPVITDAVAQANDQKIAELEAQDTIPTAEESAQIAETTNKPQSFEQKTNELVKLAESEGVALGKESNQFVIDRLFNDTPVEQIDHAKVNRLTQSAKAQQDINRIAAEIQEREERSPEQKLDDATREYAETEPFGKDKVTVSKKPKQNDIKLKEVRSRLNKQKKGLDVKPSDLLSAIAKLGGINRKYAEGVDPAEINIQRGGFNRVFPKNGGVSMDEMGEKLWEMDYVQNERPEANEVIDMVNRAMAGEDIYTLADAESKAEQDFELELIDKQIFQIDNLLEESAAYQKILKEDGKAAADKYTETLQRDKSQEAQSASQYDIDYLEQEVGNVELTDEGLTYVELINQAKEIDLKGYEALVDRLIDEDAEMDIVAREIFKLIKGEVDGREEQTTNGGKTQASEGQAEAETGRRQEKPEVETGEDRRKNLAYRKAIEHMDVGELREAIKNLRQTAKSNPLTGVDGRLAWEEELPQAVERGDWIVSIDSDSLGWANDNIGNKAGDKLLIETARVLKKHLPDVKHVSGDEFWVSGADKLKLETGLIRARKELKTSKIESEGASITGLAFSYGITKDATSADRAMKADKKAREKSGERAAKNERPAGVVLKGEEAVIDKPLQSPAQTVAKTTPKAHEAPDTGIIDAQDAAPGIAKTAPESDISEGVKSETVTRLKPKGAIEKVTIGDALSYSGDTYIYSDGSVSVPELGNKKLFPGDIIYSMMKGEEGIRLTFSRDEALKNEADRLEEGSGKGVLDGLISASEKIDRNYTEKNPGFKNDIDYMDIFAADKSFREKRYKNIAANQRRYAEQIDAEFGNKKPSKQEIKEYYLNKIIDDEATLKIGGFLHLVDNQKMTEKLFKAIKSWKNNGGKIGKTALESISDYIGDSSDLVESSHAYGVPTKKSGDAKPETTKSVETGSKSVERLEFIKANKKIIGNEPKTISEVSSKIIANLKKSGVKGFQIKTDFSGPSDSQYINVTIGDSGLKIRISDHALPKQYERSDIHIGKDGEDGWFFKDWPRAILKAINNFPSLKDTEITAAYAENERLVPELRNIKYAENVAKRKEEISSNQSILENLNNNDLSLLIEKVNYASNKSTNKAARGYAKKLGLQISVIDDLRDLINSSPVIKAENEKTANKILDSAKVTGVPRLDAISKFRDGTYTADDLRAAYPESKPAKETAPKNEVVNDNTRQDGEGKTKETDKGTALFSRGEIDAPALATSDVKIIIADLKKDVGAKINVVDTERQLPEEILAQAETEGATGEIRAVHWENEIYIVADQMRDRLDVENSLLHEGQHFQGDNYFGRGKNTAYQALWMKIGGVKGMKELAKKSGFNMDSYFETADRLVQDKKMNAGERAVYLVDEFLAHAKGNQAGESLPARIKRAIQEFIGKIRDLLRKSGFVEIPKANESDISYLLKTINTAVRDNPKAGVFNKIPAFMKEIVSKNIKDKISAEMSEQKNFDPSNEEASFVESNIENGTVKEAVESLIENGLPDQKVIAKKVLSSIERQERAGISFDFKIFHVGDKVPNALLYARGLTKYKFEVGNNKISVLLNGSDVTGKVGVSNEILLHELVHASTIAAIHLGNLKASKGTKTAEDVTDIYNITNHIISQLNKRAVEFKENYGEFSEFERSIFTGANNAFTNPHEVGTWALTNRDAQAYLEAMPYKGKKSAWTAFVESVRKLLGLPKNSETVLSEVLRVSENLMSDRINDLLGLDVVTGEVESIQSPVDEIIVTGETAMEGQPMFSRMGSERAKDKITRISKARKSVNRWFKREFTKEGLMGAGVFGFKNDLAFNIKLESDQFKNVGEEEISYFIFNLEKAVKKGFLKRYNKLSSEQLKKMSDYMKGDREVTIPDAVKDALDIMVDNLAMLSGKMLESTNDILQLKIEKLTVKQREQYNLALATNGIKGKVPENIASTLELQRKISNNMGTYVTRSYEAFDNKKWKEIALADKDLINDAKDFIRGNNPNLSELEVDGAVKGILQDAKDSGNFVSLISKGTKVGSKDVSFLKKKKDVPEVIRRLLGEYQDPKVNFARSSSKMQWYVANHYFLMRLRESGLGVFLFEKRTGDFHAKIAVKGSDTMNPLDGMFTTEDFRQGMIDAVNNFDGSDLMRNIIRLNSLVKYGKTVISPTTQARNFISASLFSVMNGHFNWLHAAKAFSVANSTIFTHDGKWRDYINDKIELGVLHDNPYAGELKDALNDIMDMDVYAKGFTQSSKKFLRLMNVLYRTGDDFWKIIGFENELQNQLNAGWVMVDARKRAAYRIRNGYPTYSMVPKFVKRLRAWPLIGSFVSFSYESVRTSYNQLEFIKEDLGQNKPAAAKRIIGTAIASSGIYAASQLSMAIMGMDDDDDEAVRSHGPEWSRNSQLYYYGYDDDGLPMYLDMSALDPYTYLKKPLSALMNGNNEGFSEKSYDAVVEMLEPFIGVDIAAGTALELFKNKNNRVYNPEDTFERYFVDILNHLRKGLQPGLASSIEKTAYAFAGIKSRSGKEYKVEDELIAWVGFRVTTLNLNKSMIYKGYGFLNAKRNSSSILSRTVGSQADVSESEIEGSFNSMMASRNRAYSDIMKLVNASRTLGVSDDDIIKSLSSANITKKDVRAIMRGDVPRWKMSLGFTERARDMAIVSTPNMERKKEIREEMLDRRTLVRELANDYDYE